MARCREYTRNIDARTQPALEALPNKTHPLTIIKAPRVWRDAINSAALQIAYNPEHQSIFGPIAIISRDRDGYNRIGSEITPNTMILFHVGNEHGKKPERAENRNHYEVLIPKEIIDKDHDIQARLEEILGTEKGIYRFMPSEPQKKSKKTSPAAAPSGTNRSALNAELKGINNIKNLTKKQKDALKKNVINAYTRKASNAAAAAKPASVANNALAKALKASMNTMTNNETRRKTADAAANKARNNQTRKNAENKARREQEDKIAAEKKTRNNQTRKNTENKARIEQEDKIAAEKKARNNQTRKNENLARKLQESNAAAAAAIKPVTVKRKPRAATAEERAAQQNASRKAAQIAENAALAAHISGLSVNNAPKMSLAELRKQKTLYQQFEIQRQIKKNNKPK